MWFLKWWMKHKIYLEGSCVDEEGVALSRLALLEGVATGGGSGNTRTLGLYIYIFLKHNPPPKWTKGDNHSLQELVALCQVRWYHPFPPGYISRCHGAFRPIRYIPSTRVEVSAGNQFPSTSTTRFQCTKYHTISTVVQQLKNEYSEHSKYWWSHTHTHSTWLCPVLVSVWLLASSISFNSVLLKLAYNWSLTCHISLLCCYG